MRKLAVALLTGWIFFAVGTQVVRAAEIKVLTAGAMRAVVSAVVADFEKQTGHKVTIDNAPAGALSRRIDGGEAVDVAIITVAVVDDLITKGRILPGSRVNLAKVGMGVAVKEGAAVPDIGSVDAFKRALLAAKAVAYSDPKAGASSGIYFDKMLDRLGIAEQVRPKAKLKAGGYVAELVASGEAEIAVHQISEIMPVKGVTLIGPLPAEIQNTTIYAWGVGAAARDGAAAKALVDFLAGPAVDPILKSKGMQKP